MQICPSMPFPKVDDYIYQLKRLSPYFKYFQLDFADGIFVEEKTAPVEDVIEALININEPWVSELILDFHFMVNDYSLEIEKLKKAKSILNINNVFIHFSAIKNLQNNPLKFYDFKVGLTLNPEDAVGTVAEHMDISQVPFIQIMSVIPGAQGRPFMPETLNKIEQLRLINYRSKIFLDGAVNDKTLPVIGFLKFKPDVVCPGSYLTKCPDNELQNRRVFLLKFS